MAFLKPDYSKEGPGIEKDQNRRQGYFSILRNEYQNIVRVNLLFVLCCLPVVTIGASMAGLAFVTRNFVIDRPGFVANDFFRAFKQNAKQAIPFGLVNTVLMAGLVWLSYECLMQVGQGIEFIALSGLFLINLMMVVMVNFYAYFLMVTLSLRLKEIIKNALILSLRCLGKNILLLLILIAALYVSSMLYPFSLFFTVLFSPTLLMIAVGFFCFPSIETYVIRPFSHLYGSIDAPIRSEKED